MKVIVEEVEHHGLSQAIVGRYFNVSKDVIKRLRKNFHKEKVFTQTRGRPLLVSLHRGEEVKRIVGEANKKKKSLTFGEFSNILRVKAKESAHDRGDTGLGIHSRMSPRTVKAYKNLLGLKAEKGQITTEARRVASLDIRNFISMAVMNHVCGEGISWHCMGNMDATQFVLNFTNASKLISVKKSNESPTIRVGNNDLDLFIKQYFLVSASGFLAQPLFIVAWDTLEDNDTIILKIPGLSFSYSGNLSGYLIFMKTRTANENFNRFLFQTYVVDFIQECRGRVGDVEKKNSFYLVIDGEASQLNALDIEEVIKIISDNNIDIGKGPASCSGVCGNALDCGNLFKATKNSIKGKEGVGQGESPNSELESTIIQEINKNEKLNKIPMEKKSKVSKAIVYLLHKEMGILTFDIIKNGFKRIGMIPEYPGCSLTNFSLLDRTLSCCPSRKDIRPNEMKMIHEKFLTLVKFFEERGEITEKEFNDQGIRKYEEEEDSEEKKKKNNNDLVLHRQRAVLLTKEASIQRRLDYKNKKSKEEEDKIIKGEIKLLLHDMVRIVDENIKNEIKLDKQKQRENLKRKRQEDKNTLKEEKKKIKLDKNKKKDNITMSDNEDDIPLLDLRKKA